GKSGELQRRLDGGPGVAAGLQGASRDRGRVRGRRPGGRGRACERRQRDEERGCAHERPFGSEALLLPRTPRMGAVFPPATLGESACHADAREFAIRIERSLNYANVST